MAEDDKEKEKPLKTTKDKLDWLCKTIGEMKHEREKEKLLSKTDSIFYVLITLSTFIIGILISQRNAIGINIIISFPLLGIIFCLIVSFIIGVRGMVNDSMRDRMLAYCLLLSLPIWYVAIPVLFYTGHYFSKLELQIGTGIITIILVLLTIWGARAFTHWFERRFPSLFDNEVNVWKSIWAYLIIFVLVILFLAIISALIMFLLVFRGLL